MSMLDQVFSDFRADVERAEHLLSLVKNFKEFGASTPPSPPVESAELWPAAMTLHDASRHRRTDLPILSGSLQLYLAGRFEYCIRQVVEAIGDEISNRASKYIDLPESIRNEIKTRTLEIVQNPRRYGYDEGQADALLSALVTSKTTITPPVVINSSVLSLTDSNMRDRVLSDILKRVGMLDFWSNVGKQASVKLELDQSTDSETTKEAQARLNAIMDERNQVAHPTANTVFPDPDQVLKSARFLKTLASTTVDLAKVYLASYRPASN
ncbi:HEPN domain-containing protein [Achromobacter xylosoxidans]